MKKIKSIIEQIGLLETSQKEELNDLLWEFICYSPQWPVRHQHQELLDTAEKFSLIVYDEYFSQKELNINGFKWGNGKNKILLTHGWASKAADFYELITALMELEDVSILAFDAPGNGSSEGGLSNLLLYAASVRSIVALHGTPEIAIGHSLGAMANVIALKHTPPSLLISLAPLVRLKENFLSSMASLNISSSAQEYFFESFETRFNIQPSSFNMNEVYAFNESLKHWLAYDEEDTIAPYPYLNEFLNKHTSIVSQRFNNVGHEKVIKNPIVIKEIIEQVQQAVGNTL